MKVIVSEPISKKKAIEIARKACIPRPDRFVCKDRKPDNCRIYNMPSEPCWFVYAPWLYEGEGMGLRSSRVILVSKLTGKILYDGSANDEG